jgi:hypothetical protein
MGVLLKLGFDHPCLFLFHVWLTLPLPPIQTSSVLEIHCYTSNVGSILLELESLLLEHLQDRWLDHLLVVLAMVPCTINNDQVVLFLRPALFYPLLGPNKTFKRGKRRGGGEEKSERKKKVVLAVC